PRETEIRKYLKYERFFHPIRFLNLVPLSHVFGQFMGLFVPPLLAGTVAFQDTLNPSEVLRTIRRERISVLVAVPRLLETLQDKLERDLEAESRLAWLRQQMQAAQDQVPPAHVALPWNPPPLRLEILGLPFRRRSAASGCGRLLDAAGVCGDPGLWTDRNHFTGERQSSLSLR